MISTKKVLIIILSILILLTAIVYYNPAGLNISSIQIFNQSSSTARTEMTLIDFFQTISKNKNKFLTTATNISGKARGELFGFGSGTVLTGSIGIETEHTIGFTPFQEQSHLQTDLQVSSENAQQTQGGIIYNAHVQLLTVDSPSPEKNKDSYINLQEQDLVQLDKPQESLQLRYGLINNFKDTWIKDTQHNLSFHTFLKSVSKTIRILEVDQETTFIEISGGNVSLTGSLSNETKAFSGSIVFSGMDLTGSIQSIDPYKYDLQMTHGGTYPANFSGIITIDPAGLLKKKSSMQITGKAQWINGLSLDIDNRITTQKSGEITYQDTPEDYIRLEKILSQLFGIKE